MNKRLLTIVLVLFGTFASFHVQAQASKGTPLEWTPVIDVKQVPKKVQQAFEETIDLAGITPLNKPKWTRQTGLYTVIFRIHSEAGPGTTILRFKPYGGLVLFHVEPDETGARTW